MDQVELIPQHIAIIMDGNRRWAKEHGLTPLEGHKKVTDDILEPLIEHAANRGVKYMTFWAFSTENWNRSKQEVQGLMNIFRHLFTRKMQRLHDNGVCVRVIGDMTKFPEDIQKTMHDVVEKTKNNRKITTIFALNYGGRDELIRAIHKISNLKEVTVTTFGKLLDTAEIPDPELIIRTSGEQRLSGFLLWQSEYSELYFPSWHMPDFLPERLDEAIHEFNRRKRRFGK